MAISTALVLTWLGQLNRDLNSRYENRPCRRMIMAGLDFINISVGVLGLAGTVYGIFHSSIR